MKEELFPGMSWTGLEGGDMVLWQGCWARIQDGLLLSALYPPAGSPCTGRPTFRPSVCSSFAHSVSQSVTHSVGLKSLLCARPRGRCQGCRGEHDVVFAFEALGLR